ncbi:MAG: hypothetical protein ACT4O6_15920 [Reyranella sp.]
MFIFSSPIDSFSPVALAPVALAPVALANVAAGANLKMSRFAGHRPMPAGGEFANRAKGFPPFRGDIAFAP